MAAYGAAVLIDHGHGDHVAGRAAYGSSKEGGRGLHEAVLGPALGRDSPGVTLEWSNYLAGSDGRITEFSLS